MKVVIIGGGHAAGQIISSLLMDEDFNGTITLIGEETWLPYQRPPLSKQFLTGEMTIEQVTLHPAEFYETNGVEMKLGCRVNAIDRTARTVSLENGETIAYDKLALTTGTRVRRLSLPGADLDGIHYVRTIDGTETLRNNFAPDKSLCVVGGGYIGLEVAAAAATSGMKVTVMEMDERVMNRVVAPQVSAFYEKMHRSHDVEIRTNVAVTGFTGQDGLMAITCQDGSSFETSLCVVGVGVIPNSELAEDCGLKCDNGITVDQFAQSEDPDIVAAGDCTNHPNAIFGTRIRLESVQNAVDQAKAAALSIMGKPAVYCAVPWFWSNQFDTKLQIVGLSQGYDQTILRGNPNDGAFSVFYLKEGILIAVDAINSGREYMMGRKWIADHVRPDPERIVDTTISVKELI